MVPSLFAPPPSVVPYSIPLYFDELRFGKRAIRFAPELVKELFLA